MTEARQLDLDHVIRIAEFRAALRTFLARSEQVARSSGLTPRQQLLLLVTKGAPDRSERMKLRDIAARLKLDTATVTELVTRAERAGLVKRAPSARDRRAVYVSLTAEGERRLTQAVEELDADRRDLAAAFRELARTFRASSTRSV